jgi:hypothetical protein
MSPATVAGSLDNILLTPAFRLDHQSHGIIRAVLRFLDFEEARGYVRRRGVFPSTISCRPS